jgi:peptidoglycan lytic transglycosylase F
LGFFICSHTLKGFSLTTLKLIMVKFIINIFLFLPLILYGCFGLGQLPATVNKQEYRTVSNDQDTILDRQSEEFIHKYGPTIQRYASRYHLDWRLVLAVMKKESRFHPLAESYCGAEGLMQIMPVTQDQIADELGLETQDFDHPHTNIRGGIYYLAKIYRSFDNKKISKEDRIKLTLAAYNAGISRISDARAVSSFMKDNPNEWSSVKVSLALLSRKYSSLHRDIWDDGHPPNGYFMNWRQTTNYVDNVWAYYEEFSKVLPNNKI